MTCTVGCCENIIIVSFDIESEGYQAITELKKNVLRDGYAVSQAVLVKNTDGHVTSLDSFDTGIETNELARQAIQRSDRSI